ncbi:MAG: SDR family NAD(P)-dependent oxidoreductase [Thermoleophilia bacterium]
MELNGRHVLVTGASRGIGASIAEAMAAKGARVTLVARSADALAEVASRTGGTALTADLADPADLDGLVARAEAATGPVDVLVNNAGLDSVGLFTSLTPERVRQTIAVNLIAPVELSRQAIPGMVERGAGHIVNISSIAGCGCVPGLGVYSATKAGLTHFTAALRAELRGLPVRTTVVEVGIVQPTDMTDAAMAYPPFRDSWNRLKKLGIVRDTPIERLTRAVVSAVERERRHVRLPARVFPLTANPEASRRMTEWVISGVVPRVPQG